MDKIYDAQGNEIEVGGGGSVLAIADYDKTVKGIAHRGFSTYPDGAPENTIPAYKKAKEAGFGYVETDISFTSDGYPVCLHDATVDRTSDGTGNINQMTLAQVKALDFGSWGDWAGSQYAGTKIPTFEEFLSFCKDAMLHPYIELKQNGGYSEVQIQGLVDTVEAYGMKGKVTWISFSPAYLGYVKAYDASARLGYIHTAVSQSELIPTILDTVSNLKTATNEVVLDIGFTTNQGLSPIVTACLAAHVPLEVWTIDSTNGIINLSDYVTGVTSNKLVAGKVLLENVM